MEYYLKVEFLLIKPEKFCEREVNEKYKILLFFNLFIFYCSQHRCILQREILFHLIVCTFFIESINFSFLVTGSA